MGLRCARFAGADALLKRRKSGKCKKYFCKLANTEKSISFSVKPNFKSDIQNIFNRIFTFSRTTNGSKIGLFRNGMSINFKIWSMGTIFVRFEKYLYMVCLKMAHLGRVTYCFETLLILCKLVFFNCNFHKNIRRQKRFVAKQGQPRPHIQLKASLLTKQLKYGLFLRLHYSVDYYRFAFLPIVIVLTLFVKYVFLRKFAHYPSSLIFIHPAPVLS